MKVFPRVLGAWVMTFLAIAGLRACGAPVGPAVKPNIVFILVDDLGWADVGCFGGKYYETPSIDRLASRGMRFTDAYAACARCCTAGGGRWTPKCPRPIPNTTRPERNRQKSGAIRHPINRNSP